MLTKKEAAVEQACAWLRAHRIPYTLQSRFHLRIGADINFYPSTGRIYVDGAQASFRAGLAGLDRLLRQRGLLRDRPLMQLVSSRPEADESDSLSGWDGA